MPSQCGVTAARLAQSGFEGCKEIFDGPHGFWVMAGSDCFDPTLFEFEREAMFAIKTGGLKPYPCCRFMHTGLECLEQLIAERHWHPSEVASVEIRTISDAVKLLAGRRPTTIIDAQFSYAYMVATFLNKRNQEVGWFESIGNETQLFKETLNRVSLVVDPEADLEYQANSRAVPATIEVVLTSGKRFSRSGTFPLGERENPLSTEKVVTKFLSLAEPVLGAASARSLMLTIVNLERETNIQKLLELCNMDYC